MAKIFNKKLNVNDYPEEDREWLSDLFQHLDLFQKSLDRAFNKRINIRENLDGDIKIIPELVLSDISNGNVTVSNNTRGLPEDILATVTRADTSRITTPVSWRINDDESITITDLGTTSLTESEFFTLRLTILGN